MAQRISKNDAPKDPSGARNKLIGTAAVVVIVIAALFLIRMIREQSIQTQIKVNAPKYSSPKGQWILEQKQKAAAAQTSPGMPGGQAANPMAPNAR